MMSNAERLRVSAPGRANLVGNPTDIYGGSIVSCSIPLRAWVELAPHAELTLATGDETCPIDEGASLELQGDRFDLARAVLAGMGAEGLRARVAFGSDIPEQSGLAGSTALVVALTQALLAWRGEVLEAHRLAERARTIESTGMGIVCGYGDQYMATFGGLRYLDFRGKEAEQGEASEGFATVESLDPQVPTIPFVLACSGVRHFSGAVHSPIRERWLAGERQVVEAYQRVAALGRLGKKALLLGDWKELGRLMNENHAIQRDLGGSGDANERLIEAALAAGAPGAKLAGAGHGGTIVALWPEEDDAPLRASLESAGAVRILRPAVEPGVRVEDVPT